MATLHPVLALTLLFFSSWFLSSCISIPEAAYRVFLPRWLMHGSGNPCK